MPLMLAKGSQVPRLNRIANNSHKSEEIYQNSLTNHSSAKTLNRLRYFHLPVRHKPLQCSTNCTQTLSQLKSEGRLKSWSSRTLWVLLELNQNHRRWTLATISSMHTNQLLSQSLIMNQLVRLGAIASEAITKRLSKGAEQCPIKTWNAENN